MLLRQCIVGVGGDVTEALLGGAKCGESDLVYDNDSGASSSVTVKENGEGDDGEEEELDTMHVGECERALRAVKDDMVSGL